MSTTELDLAARPIASSPPRTVREHPTSRQAEILRLVVRYYDLVGEGPTAVLLARACRISRAATRWHLNELHRKGWLETPDSPAIPTHRRVGFLRRSR